jgi:hypothetical protein
MSIPTLKPQPDAPVYLVLIREVLIAQDIAETIAEHVAGAQVIVAGTAAQAITALTPIAAVVIAFVSERPATFAQSELNRAIASRGGRVVLLGVDAELAGPSSAWDVLYQPFTSAAVVAQVCG